MSSSHPNSLPKTPPPHTTYGFPYMHLEQGTCIQCSWKTVKTEKPTPFMFQKTRPRMTRIRLTDAPSLLTENRSKHTPANPNLGLMNDLHPGCNPGSIRTKCPLTGLAKLWFSFSRPRPLPQGPRTSAWASPATLSSPPTPNNPLERSRPPGKALVAPAFP